MENDLSAILKRIGWENINEIQSASLEAARENKNFLGIAPTNSGKTGAFLLPIVSFLGRSKKSLPKHIKYLVLTPSREVSNQVLERFKTLSENISCSKLSLIGGKDTKKQKQKLEKGCEFVSATPQTVLKLLRNESLYFFQLEEIIFDEGDKLLSGDFLTAIKEILTFKPSDTRISIFSAIFSKSSLAEAKKILGEFSEFVIEDQNQHKNSVQFLELDENEKFKELRKQLRSKKLKKALVFLNTKDGVNKLSEALISNRISCSAFHGDLEQIEREKLIRQWKKGDIKALIASDILSRGIDVEDINFIFIPEPSKDFNNFLHRIGRSARGVSSGEVLYLITSEEKVKLQAFCDKAEITLEARGL